MTLTFYHVPNSTSSLTEAVFAELDIPHETVQLSIADGGTRKPEFLVLNPNGRVPVVVHEGTPIWESAAIAMYLGETFGSERGLYPPPGPQRGEAMKWIVWGNVTLGALLGRLADSLPDGSPGGVEEGSRDWVPPEKRSAAEADKAKEGIAKCFKVLDAGLEGRQFLLGETYSLADTHVWCLVGYAAMLGADMGPFANVGGWMKRCGERPALAALS